MKHLLALLLLCSTATAQTFVGIATPEHPFITVPGQAGVKSVTITVTTTIERSFMAANMATDADGIVIFNDIGSYQRVTVRDTLGGVIGSQQGTPFPFLMSMPDAAPVSTFYSQNLGVSTQITSAGDGWAAKSLTIPVQFQGSYVTTFQSGFVRARETVRPVATVTVTYN